MSTGSTHRAEIEKSLQNTPHLFRSSKKRQEIDGLSAAVMSNLDSQGKGPAESVMIGRKRAYPVHAYLDWLMNRITPVDGKAV